MNEIFLYLSILASFFLTLVFVPKWIEKCKHMKLLWEDMNKYKHPKNVASSGGIVVVMAFTLGVLIYIAFRTIYRGGSSDSISVLIFALLSSILIFALLGFVDDMIGWHNKGLGKGFRIIIGVFAAIPLIVLNVGDRIMHIPFLGNVNFGLFFPLLIIPLAIAGCAVVYNFLAGMNGLESGQGILIIGFFSFVAYYNNVLWLSFVGMIMTAALIGFYFYNKFPAKIFPGDSLTYSVGGLIAIMAILGNFEKIALFVFIPYFIEMILKSRGKLNKHSFGLPEKDNSLKLRDKRIYGLTHLGIVVLNKIKNKVYEKDVVYFIFAIQVIFIILAILLFMI
jgi:UDP-N-acetylglucosamine--dolichyl-phosphate N-acetylglucosaminephosphotransferase